MQRAIGQPGDGMPAGGEHAAFRALAIREAGTLLSLARRIAPEGVDPQDLVQDTLERAWRAGGAAERSNPPAWLRTVLHNRANDLQRRAQRVRFEVLGDHEPADLAALSLDDPDGVLLRAEQHDELRSALSRLPLGERMAVALHDGEGWSATDVAAIAGCSLAAAHKRIQRGRLSLVRALDRPATELRPPVPGACVESRRACLAYLDDALEPEVRARVDEHLRQCTRCPPVVGALAGVLDALGTRPAARVEPAFAARLEVLLQAQPDSAAHDGPEPV